MTTEYKPLSLSEATGGRRIPARLVTLTPDTARNLIDDVWWVGVDPGVRAGEMDHHWRWEALAVRAAMDLTWLVVGLAAPNGSIEGAMTHRMDAVSVLEPGQVAVYVDRLATAPHNRPRVTAAPRYKGAGSALLRSVVEESYNLGYAGRVILESLPSPDTLAYYDHRGFVPVGFGTSGLPLLELPGAQAQDWLKKDGLL